MIHDCDVQAVIDAVNERTGLGLKSTGQHNSYLIGVETKRGAKAAIVTNTWNLRPGEPRRYVVRSVLKVVRRFDRWTYLCNGQAGTNTKELAFWPEGDFVVTVGTRKEEER